MILDIINWLTSINFDDLIFHKSGPFLITIIYLILSFLLALKVKKDVNRRTKHAIVKNIWIILVFLTNIPGFIIYLLLRPAKIETYLEEMEQKYLELETKGIGGCSQCLTTYYPDEIFCKKCGNQIRKHCIRCNGVIEVTSTFCSYCGLQSIEKPKIESKFHRLLPRKLLSKNIISKIHVDLHLKENILGMAKIPLEKLEKRLLSESKNEHKNTATIDKAKIDADKKGNVSGFSEEEISTLVNAHDIVLKVKDSADTLPS